MEDKIGGSCYDPIPRRQQRQIMRVHGRYAFEEHAVRGIFLFECMQR